MVPPIRDNDDRAIELLEQIAAALESGTLGNEITVETGGQESPQDQLPTHGGAAIMLPNDAVNLANEYVDEGEINAIEFDGDLQAGDEEILAGWEAADDFLLVRAVGVTSHTADIDGDNQEESVVRYGFESKRTTRTAWKPLPGPSGVLPIGDLARPAPLVDGSWIGPVRGFRIKVRNRTDDANYTQTTVKAEDLGGRLEGRIIRPER